MIDEDSQRQETPESNTMTYNLAQACTCARVYTHTRTHTPASLPELVHR